MAVVPVHRTRLRVSGGVKARLDEHVGIRAEYGARAVRDDATGEGEKPRQFSTSKVTIEGPPTLTETLVRLGERADRPGRLFDLAIERQASTRFVMLEQERMRTRREVAGIGAERDPVLDKPLERQCPGTMEFRSAVEGRGDLQGVIDQAGGTRDEKPVVATAVCDGTPG